MGLVSRVVPEAELHAQAMALARVLAAKSPQLMRIGKKAFMHAIDSDYRRGVAGAVDLLSAVTGTEDSREGLTAFVEKRRPTWRPR
ncbi:MAG: enoyl-CoA hydratase/isomerase family protein, partial [Burkholderiales bacterium]|nr:enoyl-CoA hydratase/isomerase family protein [Burkholderiales bacterium]